MAIQKLELVRLWTYVVCVCYNGYVGDVEVELFLKNILKSLHISVMVYNFSNFESMPENTSISYF